jgi:acetyltransferase-like isoleucine patch superfamily enzyme
MPHTLNFPDPSSNRRPGAWTRGYRAIAREFSGLHPRLLATDLIVRLLPHLAFPQLRTLLYRLAGIEIGSQTLIAGALHLIGPGRIERRLRIGGQCYLTTPLFIDLTADVSVGDRVGIGHHCLLITSGHEIGPPEQRLGAAHPKPIAIGDGAWIGAGVTILPGVSIGPGAVVGAGSLVTSDIPANALALGVPARVIRPLEQFDGPADHADRIRGLAPATWIRRPATQ